MKLEDQKKMHEMYVHYWLAMANTGATTRRNVTRGDRQLSDEEKIDDALETAERHIHLFIECAENEQSMETR